jgi:hypothetical protein
MNVAAVLLVIAIELLVFSGAWQILEKAGKPGWGILVPGYNLFLLVSIADLHWTWILFCLIPGVNIFVLFYIFVKICKHFGQGYGYAVGIFFLPFIFLPLLGFGQKRYQIL